MLILKSNVRQTHRNSFTVALQSEKPLARDRICTSTLLS